MLPATSPACYRIYTSTSGHRAVAHWDQSSYRIHGNGVTGVCWPDGAASVSSLVPSSLRTHRDDGCSHSDSWTVGNFCQTHPETNWRRFGTLGCQRGHTVYSICSLHSVVELLFFGVYLLNKYRLLHTQVEKWKFLFSRRDPTLCGRRVRGNRTTSTFCLRSVRLDIFTSLTYFVESTGPGKIQRRVKIYSRSKRLTG